MLVRFVVCAGLVALSACSSTPSGRGGEAPSSTSVPSTSGTRAPAASSDQLPSADGALPLSLPTATATRVLTAVAPSMASTSGTVQAWQRAGAGWMRHGAPVPAQFGSQGLTTRMSESVSATPVGSYTLTQAFGSQPDPGSALPYFRTEPSDWWISKATAPDSALYNTHQRCAGSCAFTQADPNEHLVTIQPQYRYAAVIDYNTRNAPGGVRIGAGSAIFLHVSAGEPTQGCIAIPEKQLIELLRWLTPSSHPRILIGVH